MINMYKPLPHVFLFLLLSFFCNTVQAQVIAGWDMNPVTSYGPSPYAATSSDASITVGGLTRGSGVATTGTAATRAWGGTGWDNLTPEGNIASNDFVTFTITVNPANEVSLTSINPWDYRRSSTGPNMGLLQYDVNGGGYTDITTVSFSSTSSSGAALPSTNLSTVPALQNMAAGTVVTFRIVPYGATGSSGTWYVYDRLVSTANDFVLNGSACATSIFYADSDSDTYGDAGSTTMACSAPSGYVADNTDCNDADAAVNPGATEACNLIDDNCDGNIDEGVESTFYADADGDTYGDAASTTMACSAPSGYVADNTDCNDADASVNPAATEICNGLDDDCDGTIDDGITYLDYYIDSDGDGYGTGPAFGFCEPPPGRSLLDGDCDDADVAVNPVATEICNGVDDDCDGTIDDGITYLDYYIDSDGDGYGTGPAFGFCEPPPGRSLLSGDCNDSDVSINPAAIEVCNEVDDNCDGNIDEGVESTFYADADGDTYGDAGSTTMACSGPSGYVSDNTDCNDADAAVNPAATEVCNLIDDNCDGNIDEGVESTFYADADGDTYGDAGSTTMACSGPSGYVSDNTDCNDADAAVNPAATEVCNGIDDDCDGSTDEGVATATISPSGAIAICKAPSTTLSANTGIGYTYQWLKNGSPVAGATASTLNVNKAGVYTVQVTIPGGCSALSAATTVSLLPNPNANIFTPDGLDLCLDPTLKLKASVQTGYTYQWYKGGLPLAGETNAIYTATMTGVYFCRVTNSGGCSRNTASVTVFSSCREAKMQDAVLNTYPNPTSTQFTIEAIIPCALGTEAFIQIYSATGKKMFAKQISFHDGKILETIVFDETYAAGMYVVKIVAGDKQMHSQIIYQK